jgi:hypothetical protein
MGMWCSAIQVSANLPVSHECAATKAFKSGDKGRDSFEVESRNQAGVVKRCAAWDLFRTNWKIVPLVNGTDHGLMEQGAWMVRTVYSIQKWLELELRVNALFSFRIDITFLLVVFSCHFIDLSLVRSVPTKFSF